ncbi:MAG: creatininase family protein [Haloferacaceae archaeon]
MNLADSTWTEVRDLDTDLALLPVGSTEQHGPHAPLGTDAIAAETVAETAAAQCDVEVLVAPTVDYGVSEEHRAFDGTLWLSPDTFRAVVRDAVRSLAHHGFDRVVVVNGHGGNVEALAEACRRLTRGGEAYAVPFTWFQGEEEMGHAGVVETSLLRHVAPELVRTDRIEEASAGAVDRWGEWVSGVNLAVDSDEFTENGVVGDPGEATADVGEELLTRASEALCELLSAVETRDRA